MSIISKPNTFSPNTIINSSEVNSNFDTIYNDYNGNVAAANLATGAVTTAKIADANVTTAKLADANVTTAKLADASVTSLKLAENFFRGRLQSDTTNTSPTGLTIQHGWGYILGSGGTNKRETKSVTFPVSFSSAPIILCSYTGLSTTLPTDVSDFDSSGGVGTIRDANCTATTTTGFTAITYDSGNLSANYYGFTWIAIGTV